MYSKLSNCFSRTLQDSGGPSIIGAMVKFPRRVYEYLDYRRYLADYYTHQKIHEYGFSYRLLAQRAGCRSTNHAHLVITGKRNLTAGMAARFATAIGLNGQESAYFSDLVTFCQACTQSEKEHYYAKLARYSPFARVHKITEAQSRYFAQWYVPATRELAARADFKADADWIASMLEPSISVGQARRALATLFELGLLTVDESGRTIRGDGLVSSDGPLGHHLVEFHRAMLERASEAIEFFSRDEREISSLTVCVSTRRLQQLKAEIREFRHRLLKSAELEDSPECVVQINFQLFPLSKRAPL